MALFRLPRWAIPPVLGAALLFAMTVFRGVFLLFLHPGLQAVLAFLLALIVASVGGAVAGGAYFLIRIPLRYLGFIGDLLTGVILGCVYVFSILVPAKYLFGDDTLETRTDWIIAAVVAAGYGVIVVVMYWYYSWRQKKGG